MGEASAGTCTKRVPGFERARSRRTGRVAEAEWAMAFTVRAGKIARHRAYYATAPTKAVRGTGKRSRLT